MEAGGDGGGVFEGVFPDAEDAPAGLAEGAVDFLVAGDVA